MLRRNAGEGPGKRATGRSAALVCRIKRGDYKVLELGELGSVLTYGVKTTKSNVVARDSV
jgi:hypothetical protein